MCSNVAEMMDPADAARFAQLAQIGEAADGNGRISRTLGATALGPLLYGLEIWRRRHFWISLVRVDLRRRYRRSWLGIGWSLMNPIAMTIVFCFVFATLFQQEIRTYAPFVLSGLAFWNFMTGAMVEGCTCFFQGENYIRQQPAPLAIYALRPMLGLAIHMLIAMAVLLALVWTLNGFGNLAALPALVPALLIVFVFAWSLACCVGIMNVVFPDTQHMVVVAMQMLFYMTPVFYSPDLIQSREIARIFYWNPLAAFLRLVREPILHGQFAPAGTWCLAAASAGLALAMAAWTLHRFERRLIFYL